MKTQIQFRIDNDLKKEAQHIINKRCIESLSSIATKAISDYVKKYEHELKDYEG